MCVTPQRRQETRNENASAPKASLVALPAQNPDATHPPLPTPT
ncbi:MAG TPA: hypothetical protein VH496_21970 [Mycobacterium sp.]